MNLQGKEILINKLPNGKAASMLYFVLTVFYRMVSSYLVHHGYCATAEAFARSTDQTVLEELASIKNRQSKLECAVLLSLKEFKYSDLEIFLLKWHLDFKYYISLITVLYI